jgi:hypothetical protein
VRRSRLRADSKWKTLILRTAYLHEWLPITGFQAPTFELKGGQAVRYSENWKALAESGRNSPTQTRGSVPEWTPS